MFNYTKETFSAQERFNVQSWDYQEDSNFTSLINYINWLFGKRSKLLVVRIDLSFRVGAQGQYDAEYARECFQRLLNNSRCNRIFKNKIGHIWGLEWGMDKGFHYHCIFLFDGHESNRDEPIGHLIGQYWRDAITGGTGYYRSCNDDKYNLARLGQPVGMGMVHRNDVVMRENLAWISTYLLKDVEKGEQQLRAVLPESLKRFRTFGHGEMR
ncbi:MAG: inovirus-type Gp2 protein [Formivibrio sp.]|nr:inovirus-type Gp2 protein [Formivibrio sp.]